jgi:hypothetical protein
MIFFPEKLVRYFDVLSYRWLPATDGYLSPTACIYSDLIFLEKKVFQSTVCHSGYLVVLTLPVEMVFQSVSMDSLKYCYCQLCATTICPVGGHPNNSLAVFSGLAAHQMGSLRSSYYPLGSRMPYGPVYPYLFIPFQVVHMKSSRFNFTCAALSNPPLIQADINWSISGDPSPMTAAAQNR